MSIRLRLAVTVAVITAALTAAGGLLFATSLNAGITATLQRTLTRTALRSRDELAAGRLRLPAGSSRPAKSRTPRVVQVIDPGGQVDYTTVTAGASSLLTPRQSAAAARRGSYFVAESRPGWTAPRLLLAQPARAGIGAPGIVIVGTTQDEPYEIMARVRDEMLAGGPLVVAIAALGAWLLAGRALQPVEQLRAQAAAMSSAGHRLAGPQTGDELSKLADTFNELLDRLHGALVRQREFVAAAGHELRTPLAVLRAELELAQRPGRTEEELRTTLGVLGPRLDQLCRLSQDLLLLAGGDEGVLPLDQRVQPLEPLTARSLLSLRARADQDGVALALNASPSVTAAVDAGRFQQILENLVVNALEHATGTEIVEVSLYREDGWAVLAVADEGPGLPEDFLPRAFERFARADPARRKPGSGPGLGLASVAMLAAAHTGNAEIRNRPAGGAVALVRFPLAAGQAPERPGRAPHPRGSR